MFAEVTDFWFKEITPRQWFTKNEDFDALIRARFGSMYEAARAGECFAWRTQPLGRLAEIIALDQFPRNMYRDTAKAFETDALALVLAQEAIATGADQMLAPEQRNFLYMPFMHSESLKIHDVAVRLFEANGRADNLDFELRHRKIIERFGRYPHRNVVLGRESSAEELAFLAQPGSGF